MLRSCCSVEGCERSVIAHGVCRNHYYRLMKHGSATAGRSSPGSAMAWVEGTALKCQSDECLAWPFSKASRGYGNMHVDGRQIKAHRFICELAHGPAPNADSVAAHSCGKGHLGCVNPRHLRWATPSENQMDRVAHGTSARGSKCVAAKLTEADVLAIRKNEERLSQKELSARYGVAVGTIGGIAQGRAWTWL